MYSNIDKLADDTQKVNYAATAYSAKKKADSIPPKKSLIPTINQGSNLRSKVASP